MFLGRLTLSDELTICHVSVSTWGYPPNRGRVHVPFASAPTTSPQDHGVVKLYVNAASFRTWLGGFPHLPGVTHLHVNCPLVNHHQLS